MEILLIFFMAIGLSSACGYRVFIPPLIMNISHHAGYLTLNSNFNWLVSDFSFFVLLLASILEISSYYVPWLDNLLDTISFPLSIIAGTILTSSFITGIDPAFAWTLSAIVGGGSAGVISSSTSAIRMISTTTTGGLTNPIISTLENIMSFVISILSIIAPLIAIIISIFFIYKIKNRKRIRILRR